MNQSKYVNLSVSNLVEHVVTRKEGALTSTGAIAVLTGKYTGRSPADRFLVMDDNTKKEVDWGAVNVPFDPESFDKLYEKVLEHLKEKPTYQFDGFAGADTDFRIPIRVINEYAWHNLFIRQLLVRRKDEDVADEPAFTILCAPGCKADPTVHGTRSETFIVIDLSRRIGIIGGTEYAGEMKKMVFSVMNYLLPEQGVFPMHCSANIGENDDVALFFGLSGTGKTTLSTDPARKLIGDDEHGWTDDGVFNFEGGCYAKTIGLRREHEPQIWDAIKFGAVLENVVLDPESGEIDFESDQYTENTRVGYPIDHIPGAVLHGTGSHPKTIFFLTADAFGVLPPITKLNKEQALYYFLSGYTSKLAGTERGVEEPEATFSACFGAPFIPRPATVYADLLGKRIEKHSPSVFLVNTGWTGGPYGVGHRMNLTHTRAMITAALSGELDEVRYRTDEYFGLSVPVTCPGVPDEVLDPVSTWDRSEEYETQANMLRKQLHDNFDKLSGVRPEIREAGPYKA